LFVELPVDVLLLLIGLSNKKRGAAIKHLRARFHAIKNQNLYYVGLATIKAGLLTLALAVCPTIRLSALPLQKQWLTFVNERRIRVYSGGTVQLNASTAISAFPVNPVGNLLSVYFPIWICKPPEHSDIILCF